MCACVRACVRACVCVCVREREREREYFPAEKVQFRLQTAEIKNENVDSGMYRKSNVMKFTPQDTGKPPRSYHDDLLEVQYL